eukprot:6195887-Pleurochrysis_carterae.AAC.2
MQTHWPRPAAAPLDSRWLARSTHIGLSICVAGATGEALPLPGAVPFFPRDGAPKSVIKLLLCLGRVVVLYPSSCRAAHQQFRWPPLCHVFQYLLSANVLLNLRGESGGLGSGGTQSVIARQVALQQSKHARPGR